MGNNNSQNNCYSFNNLAAVVKKADKDLIDSLNENFEEFRCSKCYKKILIQIERKKEDNNKLYIISKCKDRHLEEKPVFQFMKENSFKLDYNYALYDYVIKNAKNLEELLAKRSGPNTGYIDDDQYFICFKCKKIFYIKSKYLYFVSTYHKHKLFGYYEDYEEHSIHYFEFKDFDYLDKKILQEKNYINELNRILEENKLKKKYLFYLNEIEAEINFFNRIYKLYSKAYFKRETRIFQNLFNIFNHKINLFHLKEENLKKNNKLNSDIKNINDKLSSVYSSNTFENKEKLIIDNYEIEKISFESIKIVIPLNGQYLAAGGDNGLRIFKLESKNLKKEINSILYIKDIPVDTMVLLIEEKILLGGEKGIFLIQFDNSYYNYRIIANVYRNEKVKSIIKIDDRTFLNLSIEPNNHINKWVLFNEEKNKRIMEKMAKLKNNEKIENICEINKKYFAYQTKNFIIIINIINFKNYRKIIIQSKGICKYNNKYIGVLNLLDISFYNIETGMEEFKIREINYYGCVNIKQFYKRKIENEEIIAIMDNRLLQFSKYNNEWLLIGSITKLPLFEKFKCLNYVSEMEDKTILLASKDNILYVLTEPLYKNSFIY